MRPYSQDLRERVASACAEPGRTIAQVAAAFSGRTAFVNKLLRRQRTTGSVAARPHMGGPAPKLDMAAQAQRVAWVGKQPDSTLADRRAALLLGGGPAMSLTLIWQVLAAHELRRKKRVSTPPNATRSG